jgi:uncharacterized protein (TIGR03437 family)
LRLILPSAIVIFVGAVAPLSQIYAQSGPPAVADGGVLNGASFAKGQATAPGSLISIFGTGMATTTALADSIPLSTSLGNVTVTFNGIQAPLNGVFHDPVNGDQINAQLPWNAVNGAQSGSAQVVVTRAGISSAAVSVPVASVSPGIFSVQFGVGTAIAINSDGSLAAPAGSIPGLATHPAKVGDQNGLIILATGLGPVNPPVMDGQSANDGTLHTAVTMPTVMVGGVQVQVLFAGMSPQFVGVNQINVFLPPGTPVGDSVPIQLQVGGVTTTNQVTIAVTN